MTYGFFFLHGVVCGLSVVEGVESQVDDEDERSRPTGACGWLVVPKTVSA